MYVNNISIIVRSVYRLYDIAHNQKVMYTNADGWVVGYNKQNNNNNISSCCSSNNL